MWLHPGSLFLFYCTLPQPIGGTVVPGDGDDWKSTRVAAMHRMQPAGPAPPRGRAAKYKSQRVIGRGAFGTAFLVRNQADSRLYVMKRLTLEHMTKKERDDALNECTVMMKLRRHPNVIRVHEYFEEANRLNIIMDYADGGDLAQRIEAQAASKTPFAEVQVLNWFVQICLALKHAHDRKVLHRDLKPQNVFLTRMNLVRLGDFGISKVLSGTMSVANTCVGTPLYLAPELCEGKEYGNKCDVWSIGVILYELLALETPFTARVMPALVMRICGSEAPPLPDAFSLPTRELAFELLIKDPARRPRVHEVLERDFIKSRIESFLDAKLMQEEFSHTLFHNSPSPAPGPAAQPPAPSSLKRNNPHRHPAPMDRLGTGSRKPGAGGTPTRAAALAAATARDSAEDRDRTLQRAEAEQRREATREQIRRDRRAKGARDEPAMEILLPIPVCPGIPPDGVSEAPVAVGPSDAPRAEMGGPTGGCAGRTVIEAAHPGSRMLSREEVEAARARLLRRQAELTAELGASELSGEVGRKFVNERQRLLLSIERTLGALAMQYVLVDEAAGGGGVLAGELNASICEELMPDEGAALRASPPSPNIAIIACVPDDDVLEEELAEYNADGNGLANDSGREAGHDEPRTNTKPARPVEEEQPHGSAAPGMLDLSAASVCEEIEAPPAEAATSRSVAGARPAPVAWDISIDAPPPPHVPVARKSSSGAGGIAFEISLDNVSDRPARKRAGTYRTPPMAAAAAPAPVPDLVKRGSLGAESGAIPSGLFAVGSSLPTKVRLSCTNGSPRRSSDAYRNMLRICHATRKPCFTLPAAHPASATNPKRPPLPTFLG